MSVRNRTYRPAAQSPAAARPSLDGGWRVVFPPAVGSHNPRSRETTRVTPFAHLHIGSFNCHSFAWHDAKGDKNPGILDIPTALDGTSLFRWDNSPADDIKEQKAIQLEENEDNIIGDKVIYYTDALST